MQNRIGQHVRRTKADPRMPGFALRRRLSQLAEKTWRDTVVRYRPAPWLAALAHGGQGAPFRPGHRPEANR